MSANDAGPRVVLASCRNLPAWEVDDRPLEAALRARGAEVTARPWDDPGLDPTSVDAILLRTTWDYVPRAAEFLAWAGGVERSTRLFNPARLVRWNADKTYLRDLERAGVPTVETIWLEGDERRRATTGEDLAALLAGRAWRRGFLKPIVGASAVGALRFDLDANGLAAAARHLREFDAPRGFLLQPYVDAVETRGEVSAVFVDGEYTHGVRKLPLPGDFRVQDDYGASDRREDFADADLEPARRALAAAAAACDLAAPPLYARADFLDHPTSGLLLVELELIEPSLFFRHAPHAAGILAERLLDRIG